MSQKIFVCCCSWLLVAGAVYALDAKRVANSIPLTSAAVENLGIETVEAEKVDFESSFFTLGRIEEIPSSRSVLSSRIPGRAIEVNVFPGDVVVEGQTLVVVESLQPGNPPPRIPLMATRGGLVVESHVRLGQPIEPSRELLDIADRSQLWAVASVPEELAASVAVGTKARLRIPAIGGEAIEATVARYGLEVDKAGGTVPIIFELENSEGTLRPGMRVEFSVVTASREDVMAVPIASIQGDAASPVVFVKDFDLPNVFVKAPVVLGEKNDTHVEIQRGLFPGDEVVTTGAYALNYAGGTSTLSLKDVLDAAHGHEHNEDGSELTPAQTAAKEAEKKAAQAGPRGPASIGSTPQWLLIYTAIATLAFLVALQLWWAQRRKLAKSGS